MNLSKLKWYFHNQNSILLNLIVFDANALHFIVNQIWANILVLGQMSFVALENHMYVDFSYIRVPTVVSEIEWNALPLDMCKRVTIRIFEEKLTANSEITCDKQKPDFYVLGGW